MVRLPSVARLVSGGAIGLRINVCTRDVRFAGDSLFFPLAATVGSVAVDDPTERW